MTSTSSKLKYCIQKTTIQRDVGLRIYYFAYMNSPLLFLVPSILHICYSNYKLKKQANKMVDDIFTGENSCFDDTKLQIGNENAATKRTCLDDTKLRLETKTQ